MSVRSCIPVIPSSDLEKSLRFWTEGLGFSVNSEMREGGKLIFCMLQNGDLWFMLNRRARAAIKPSGDEGIRLYWAPDDLQQTREKLLRLGYHASDIDDRDYGQSEFVLTDDDGYSHCFGVPTSSIAGARA